MCFALYGTQRYFSLQILIRMVRLINSYHFLISAHMYKIKEFSFIQRYQLKGIECLPQTQIQSDNFATRWYNPLIYQTQPI